jgi:hypothetical protein
MFIIGNNMNIWPQISKLKNDGNLNPFDNYSRTVASEISSQFQTPIGLNFSDEWKDPSKLLSYQRLAYCLS